MTRSRLGIAALVATGALLAAAVAVEPFPHEDHGKLFVQCQTCHPGAAQPGKPFWPTPADCGTCHDGTIEKEVPWTPRTGILPSNLRFTHETTHAISRGSSSGTPP